MFSVCTCFLHQNHYAMVFIVLIKLNTWNALCIAQAKPPNKTNEYRCSNELNKYWFGTSNIPLIMENDGKTQRLNDLYSNHLKLIVMKLKCLPICTFADETFVKLTFAASAYTTVTSIIDLFRCQTMEIFMNLMRNFGCFFNFFSLT